MSKRRARLNEQLRRELTELIRRDVRDPRVGLVTITGVDVSADLSHAQIYVRVTGGGDELTRSLEGLAAAASFLRTSLGRILHVRRVPELHFREDRSYEGAQRIEQVLSEVFPGSSSPGAGTDDSPTEPVDGAPEAGDDDSPTDGGDRSGSEDDDVGASTHSGREAEE